MTLQAKEKEKKGEDPRVSRTEAYIAARTRPDKAKPPILSEQLREALVHFYLLFVFLHV